MSPISLNHQKLYSCYEQHSHNKLVLNAFTPTRFFHVACSICYQNYRHFATFFDLVNETWNYLCYIFFSMALHLNLNRFSKNRLRHTYQEVDNWLMSNVAPFVAHYCYCITFSNSYQHYFLLQFFRTLKLVRAPTFHFYLALRKLVWWLQRKLAIANFQPFKMVCH